MQLMKFAWMVTWEGIGEHVEIPKKVAAIINYRKSAEYVREFIEQLYVYENAIDLEMADYAKDKKSNPYPARFEMKQGLEWTGRIECGINPFLYARRVDNVRSVTHDGDDSIAWDERPIPARFLTS